MDRDTDTLTPRKTSASNRFVTHVLDSTLGETLRGPVDLAVPERPLLPPEA
jgi:hypothetical protein